MAGAVAVSRLLGVLLGGGALLLLVRSFGSCSSPSENAPKPDAGADADAPSETITPDVELDAPADHPTPPWDPVWHETKPAAFTVVPPGPRRAKSCGAGCKVIAETVPAGSAQRRPRADDQWAVFQVVPGGRVHAVHLKTETEYVVDDGNGWPEGVGAGGGPSVSNGRIFYGVATMWGGLLVVRSLVTGEAKIVRSYGIGQGSITKSFADPFIYWESNGVYRFDLRDGSLKAEFGGGCIILEGASNGLATCAGEGFVDLIDFDKGTSSKLGSSKYEDIAGSISPDGKTAAWADTRHPGPKGEIATWLDPYGSEIYTKDLTTGKESRVTWDSPLEPSVKTFPRLVAGRLVWQSWEGIELGWPQSMDLWETPAPLWVSINGANPSPMTDQSQVVGFPQPITTGVVGTWFELVDGGSSEPYLVHIAWPAAGDGG